MTDFATLVMRAKTDELGRAEDDLDSLGSAAERTERRVGQSGRGMERSASTTSAGIVRSLGKIVVAYASVQSAMQAVNMARGFNAALAEASTLIEGSAEEMAFLEDSARDLAKAYGTEATAQVKAFYQAISAGAGSVQEAAALLDQANKLAVGGVTDVTTAVDALTTAVSAYGPDILSAADASDAMFVAMRAGKTTIGELSASLGQVIPIASAAGVSFDETTAAIAALTTQGLSTSMATTGLRQVIASVIKPTKEAADMAKELGIQFDSSALKAQGFERFIAGVVDATDGNQDAMAALFGSVEALGAALAFSGGAGETFSEIMEDMGVKAGATEAAFAKMSDSLNERWNRAAAAMRDIALTLGNALLTVLVPAVEGVAEVLGFVTENADTFAVALGALVATQIPAMIAGLIGLATWLTTMEGLFIAGAVASRALAIAMNAIPFVAVASAAVAFWEITNASREASNVANIYSAALDELKTALDGVNLATDEGMRKGREIAAAHLEQAKAAVAAAEAELARWEAMKKVVDMDMDLEGSSFVSQGIEQANRELAQMRARLQGISDQAREMGIHINGLAPPLRDTDTVLGAILTTADNLNAALYETTGIDLAPIFAAAQGPADALLTKVTTILDKAMAAGAAILAASGAGSVDARGETTQFGPGSRARSRPRPASNDIDFGLPPVPTGGGGASEAEKQAEAIKKVVDALSAEIALVGEGEEARRLDQELRKAGVDIHSEEGQKIAELVEELTQLEAAEQRAAETMKVIEDGLNNLFVDVLSGAESAEDAIASLLGQLGKLFLNQAFQMLWNGGGGIGGGGISGILGLATGGPAMAGVPYLVNEDTPNSEIFVPSKSGAVLNVRQAQEALRGASGGQNITVLPAPVYVLDDPAKYQRWNESPEGERSNANVNRRLGVG